MLSSLVELLWRAMVYVLPGDRRQLEHVAPTGQMRQEVVFGHFYI